MNAAKAFQKTAGEKSRRKNMSELTALKCKTCENILDLTTAIDGVVECPYCYNKWTVAKKEADPAVLQFLRMGEHGLDTAKFDDAFAAYSKAAELDGSEPEAYFGKALARFKVQYLKDEVNNRMQPICHAVTTDKFSDDTDYMRAYMKATTAQRAEYEKRAKDIDYIQSEFAKLEKSGADYDCFICVKVTDDDTKLRTSDYKTADDIYFALRGKNYKPFFSERELEGVTGADYEARILYALKKSECMLVVCSDEEYLQTKWVKNEYARFLKLVNDEEKESDSIAVAFKGKPIERLPGKNGKLQGIDLNKLGALSRVEEFVEAHTPESRARRAAELAAKAKAEEEKERRIAEQQKILEEQQKNIAEQLEKLKSASSANMGNISYEELAKNIEKERLAREEAERKKAEEEEAARRTEGEKLDWIRENDPTVEIYDKSDFEISGTVLKKCTSKKTALKIPRGVTSIDNYAFEGRDSLTSITLPDSVTTIGEMAFKGCFKLNAVYITDLIAWCNIKFNGLYASPVWYAHNLYLNNKLVTEVTAAMLKGVTELKDYVFAGCRCLKSIAIPVGVTVIGVSAFNDCENLAGITIPKSVKNIGGYAFKFCINLENITIPQGVKFIGERAFCDCAFKELTIPDNVISIGYQAFKGCDNLESIKIGNGVEFIGAEEFRGREKLTSVTIGSGVTSIRQNSFGDCVNLKSIVIPETVTSIDFRAFYGSVNLTIYCRASKRPFGWDKEWDLVKEGNIFTAKRAKVVWGYKG